MASASHSTCSTRRAFQACLDAGVNAAASWFFKNPGKPPAKALNPGQAQIIRVLNLVRKNAEVKEIEAALKQDVALSYKLLRYINSAGFGLSCEIQSLPPRGDHPRLREAQQVAFAAAGHGEQRPDGPGADAYRALTRARLMELLSHGLVDRQEYDNCSSPARSRCSMRYSASAWRRCSSR